MYSARNYGELVFLQCYARDTTSILTQTAPLLEWKEIFIGISSIFLFLSFSR